MMDCAQYRRSILADPHDPNPELKMHRDGCRDCPEYTERLLHFENCLERALRVNTPAAGDAAVVPLRAPAAHAWTRPLRLRGGWLAMAASVLIVVVVAGSLWLAAPGSSLAADVVAHTAAEPQAWSHSDIPVARSELALVLSEAHVRLDPNAGTVSYARSCLFRGHRVPHLVVQTEMGAVTVMVLVHETVSGAVPFDEEGYRGVILPVPGHGSLAVLARGQSADQGAVRKIAARVLGAIVWTD
jgi:hypothetical protein